MRFTFDDASGLKFAQSFADGRAAARYGVASNSRVSAANARRIGWSPNAPPLAEYFEGRRVSASSSIDRSPQRKHICQTSIANRTQNMRRRSWRIKALIHCRFPATHGSSRPRSVFTNGRIPPSRTSLCWHPTVQPSDVIELAVTYPLTAVVTQLRFCRTSPSSVRRPRWRACSRIYD
jgi:hypothetical protein